MAAATAYRKSATTATSATSAPGDGWSPPCRRRERRNASWRRWPTEARWRLSTYTASRRTFSPPSGTFGGLAAEAVVDGNRRRSPQPPMLRSTVDLGPIKAAVWTRSNAGWRTSNCCSSDGPPRLPTSGQSRHQDRNWCSVIRIGIQFPSIPNDFSLQIIW